MQTKHPCEPNSQFLRGGPSPWVREPPADEVGSSRRRRGHALRSCESTGRLHTLRQRRIEQIAPSEAGAWLLAQGRPTGALRGHRFAVGVRGARGLLESVATFCQPPSAFHDGVTIALVAIGARHRRNWCILLSAVDSFASWHGYRRVVTDAVGQDAEHHLVRAGWVRISGGRVWCRTPRASAHEDRLRRLKRESV
ncbi:MAG TPA: hypothetical protein PK177_04855 [Burkholderiaceae bacterium]|nr:hypothetical protein [Burkholderiaceae bacterium]